MKREVESHLFFSSELLLHVIQRMKTGNKLRYLGRVTRPIPRVKKRIVTVKLEKNITYDAKLSDAKAAFLH